MNNNVLDTGAYAKFEDLPKYQYRVLTYLFSNENLWKLLNYDTPDALYLPNLTTKQKQALIYRVSGSTYPQDTTMFRVFMTNLSDDIWNTEHSLLRITVPTVVPDNRTEGIMTFEIDVLNHTKIDPLQGDMSRKVCLLSNVLGSLNGAEIQAVGKLAFSRQSSYEDKAVAGSVTNGKTYDGYKIILSTHYSA